MTHWRGGGGGGGGEGRGRGEERSHILHMHSMEHQPAWISHDYVHMFSSSIMV